mgnify:CR=1 FL=1
MKRKVKKRIVRGVCLTLAAAAAAGLFLQTTMSVQAATAMPGIETIVKDNSEDKPLRILELVDNSADAEIGYYISRQEPYIKLYTYQYTDENGQTQSVHFKNLEEGLSRLPEKERKEFVMNVSLKDDGTIDESKSTGIQRVEMKDDFTKVEIFKADMTDGHELPGAKLKITDASGNTIAEWETNGQPHRIERLKPGDYTLTETAAPAGYLLSEEVHFTVQETGEIQKVTMYDAPAHSLILTKRDIATNAKLADARLTIRDAYGTTIDRWTTTDGDHAIRVLPERSAAKDPHKNLLLLSDDTSEHVYTMVEELAPDGYLVAESITFKVMQMNDALVVFIWQDGGWQKSSEGYLAMYDERTDTPVPLMKTFPQTGSIL